MPDVYIGLDPSLTGFGVAAVGAGVDHTWLIKSKKSGVDRLLDISYTLNDIFEEVRRGGNTISDVAIEDTVWSSHSASALGELAGTVKMTCHTVLTGPGRYPLRVPPPMLKKYATGRGNAKKIEIVLSVYKHFGKEFRDDNEADAYVLAKICSGHSQTKYQQEVLDKLRSGSFRDAHEV